MKLSTSWIGDWIELGDLDDMKLDETLTGIGHAIEDVQSAPDGRSLDLEITTNRIDAMSHLGMARELGAALDREVKPVDHLANVDGLPEYPVTIEVPEMCGRFAALAIDGVTVRPSSERIRKRLESVGLRPVNNVVDATNYVMLDLGHPLHAFDRDRIEGDRILVRAGRPGEKLTTLDGETRDLDDQTVVIADGSSGIGLGGVMGGHNSEIGNGTTRVLLECAWFNPVTIRLTSRRLNLKTDASYRFERRVDPEDAAIAIRRCAALIIEEAGGTPVAFTDEVVALPEPVQAELRKQRIELFSGGAIDLKESSTILQALGMKIRREEDRIIVDVPSWRGDITSEIDLIEEVLRFHGYDRIEAALPRLSTGDVRRDDERELEEVVRDALAAYGLSEVVTYSFMRPEQLFAVVDEKPLAIENALSENTSAMRTTILAGLFDAVASNWAQGNREGAVFEVGRTYHPDGDDLKERSRAAFAIWGSGSRHWDEKSREVDFYSGRGLFDQLGSDPGAAPEWKTGSARWGREGFVAEGSINGETAAVVAVVDPSLCGQLGIRTTVVAGEIALDAFSADLPDVEMREVSRYPGIPIAFAFRHSPELSWSEIAKVIEESRPDELADWGLWDRFEAPDDERIKTTLAIWYQAGDRSLSQSDVEEKHQQLRKAVSSRLPIEME